MLQTSITPDVKVVSPATREATPPRVIRSRGRHRLLTFLMVAGPGLIVTMADNDAGAVSTYAQAGAQYGTRLLWILLLLLPVTYFIQEMVARLGIATGEGHAAMIYRRFGSWWGRFSLFDLILVNFLTLVTEFAAISLAASQMGMRPQVAVPGAALALIAMTLTGSYRRWEKMALLLCVLDLAWFVVAFMAAPPASQWVHDTLVPGLPPGGLRMNLIFLIVAIVGTTIAPWQLFFQQSCVADKRLRFADLPWARLDTFIGACMTVTIAGCMLAAGDLARRHGLAFDEPAHMASALLPFAGATFKNLFLMLMVNAAILGATTISLSSSWAYGEVMGWPHSLHKSVREAPGFYTVYAVCVVAAGAIVLLPSAPLQLIIVGVQVLAGLMLPSAIIFLQLLLNDRDLLGERWINKRWNNAVNWTIVSILFLLSLVLALQVVAPSLFPA